MLKNVLTRIWPVLIILCGVSLPACSHGLIGSQPEEGVVEVWASWGDAPKEMLALFDRYSQANGVPVKVKTGVKSNVVQKTLSGSAPPDLVILSNNDLVGFYHEQGLVEPLDSQIETSGINFDDIYPAALAQCQSPDSQTICLPWGFDVDVLYWNKDLFAEAGLDPERPPQTLEEMVEYARKLTQRDANGQLSRVGFIPDFPRPHTDLYARMFGGSFTNNGNIVLMDNSQPLIDTLAWQQAFYNQYVSEELEDFVSSFTPYMKSSHPLYAGRRMSCRQCHAASSLQNKQVPDNGFFDGRIAMMIDGQWQAESYALSQVRPPLNYGVAPVPPSSANPERANTSVVRGPVVIIPSGSVDKNEALKLLAWMSSPEILADAASFSARLPSSQAAARDPRFHQVPEQELLLDLIAQPNAGTVVPLPEKPDLNEMLGLIEQKSLHEEGDLAQLLSQIQTESLPRHHNEVVD